VLNVNLKESPAARLPESKALVSEVTVWVATPLFVQQTVAPGATDSDDGVKEKSTTETVASPASQGVATVGEADRPRSAGRGESPRPTSQAARGVAPRPDCSKRQELVFALNSCQAGTSDPVTNLAP
jgi:hypothetical protein